MKGRHEGALRRAGEGVGTMGLFLAARLDAAMLRDGDAGKEEFAGTAVGRLVLGLKEPDQRAAGLYLHSRLLRVWNKSAEDWALRGVSRLPLRWTAEQAVELLARFGERGRCTYPRVSTVEVALAALESLGGAGLDEGLRRAATELYRWLPELQHKAERAALARRVEALLSPHGDVARWALLDDDDAYGPRMRAEHPWLLESPEVAALLLHCGTLGQVTAGVGWRRTARALVAAAPRGREAVVVLLEGFAAQPEGPFVTRGGHGVPYLRGLTGRANTCLVRGLLWVLADLAGGDAGGEWAVRLAGECARHAGTGVGGRGGDSRSQQVATAAVAVLGGFDGELGPLAIAELAAVRKKVRNRTVLKGAERAQQEVAARAGTSPARLRERAVPAAGLDAEHRREAVLPDGSTAVLAVDAAGAAALTFRTAAGRVVKSAPASARAKGAGELAALRADLKALRGLLSAERARLEDCLTADEHWTGAEWQRFYVDHPVTGALAGALLWEVRPQDARADGAAKEAAEVGWYAGLPERAGAGWVLAGADGTAAPVAAGDTVRMWHPLRAPVAEVATWRTVVTEREVRQPFKQAFREIYPLTPAEEATGGYSNRFAAHVLRFGQARSLMAARGWSASHLGGWDGGYDGEAVKEVPSPGPEGWRVRFDYQLVEEGYEFGSELCSTNRVRFEHRADPRARWTQAPLVRVPALVLSEAMRDVDLFVGVASVAADPRWQDGPEGRHVTYWQQLMDAPLPPSAEVRREALARLLPRTRIADRVEVSGRFLRVRGDLATYRIHIGSANVLVEPNDTYLCIVAAAGGGKSGERVFLPFEEDGGLLSVVLSKAFLLAADTAITDPTILRQLPGGPAPRAGRRPVGEPAAG